MTAEEYRREVRRTVAPLSSADMTHHALWGITAEVGEIAGLYQKTYQGHGLDRDRLLEELGDLTWFLHELAAALGISFDRDHIFYVGSADESVLISAIIALGDLHCCYPSRTNQRLRDNLLTLLNAVHNLAVNHGSSLEEVIKAKVAKLRARYPDGFEVARSLDRAGTTSAEDGDGVD